MRKASAAVVFTVFLMYGASVLYDRHLERTDPVGYRNNTLCFTLRPGIGEKEIVELMGSPTGREEGGAGYWLHFRSLRVSAGQIKAEIDGETKKVVTLRCREEGPPTWETGE